jgi:hypothetical protein
VRCRKAHQPIGQPPHHLLHRSSLRNATTESKLPPRRQPAARVSCLPCLAAWLHPCLTWVLMVKTESMVGRRQAVGGRATTGACRAETMCAARAPCAVDVASRLASLVKWATLAFRPIWRRGSPIHGALILRQFLPITIHQFNHFQKLFSIYSSQEICLNFEKSCKFQYKSEKCKINSVGILFRRPMH